MTALFPRPGACQERRRGPRCERRTMRAFLISLILSGLALPVRAAEPAFAGRWDCGVGEFRFTADSYDPGGEPMEIHDIAVEGNTYVLTFADDYQLSLEMNPDGTMAWFSPVSGDSFICRRLP